MDAADRNRDLPVAEGSMGRLRGATALLVARCGFSFVPVEVVQVGEERVHLVLNPDGLGEVHVHADRAQSWHPFYIRAVERTALA
jgi:hypothetical protein